MNSFENPQLSYECDREARIVQLETQVQELRAVMQLYLDNADDAKGAMFLDDIDAQARLVMERTK